MADLRGKDRESKAAELELKRLKFICEMTAPSGAPDA